jgi:23S rRNA (cytosine1962-C5)-methyltransferase
MITLTTKGFGDYELLDSGDGMRLERYGKYRFVRPDPQCIWKKKLPFNEWNNVDAVFQKLPNGKEGWQLRHALPQRFPLHYKDIHFYGKLTPFKHIGVFPEQILQWDWMEKKMRSESGEMKNKGKQLNVLNLFGYTGIASLVAANAGAKVTHLDASSSAVVWARDNQALSKLEDKPIRWIVDDALEFCRREIRRDHRYDGILMDPPIYGHGPDGQKWDFYKSFPQLMALCQQLLTDKPLFIIVNAYAISASALMLENVLKDYTENLSGTIECGELALEEKSAHRLLSTGIFARWSAK